MASPNRWYVGNPRLRAGVLKAAGKGFSQIVFVKAIIYVRLSTV